MKFKNLFPLLTLCFAFSANSSEITSPDEVKAPFSKERARLAFQFPFACHIGMLGVDGEDIHATGTLVQDEQGRKAVVTAAHLPAIKYGSMYAIFGDGSKVNLTNLNRHQGYRPNPANFDEFCRVNPFDVAVAFGEFGDQYAADLPSLEDLNAKKVQFTSQFTPHSDRVVTFIHAGGTVPTFDKYHDYTGTRSARHAEAGQAIIHIDSNYDLLHQYAPDHKNTPTLFVGTNPSILDNRYAPFGSPSVEGTSGSGVFHNHQFIGTVTSNRYDNSAYFTYASYYHDWLRAKLAQA